MFDDCIIVSNINEIEFISIIGLVSARKRFFTSKAEWTAHPGTRKLKPVVVIVSRVRRGNVREKRQKKCLYYWYCMTLNVPCSLQFTSLWICLYSYCITLNVPCSLQFTSLWICLYSYPQSCLLSPSLLPSASLQPIAFDASNFHEMRSMC